MSVYTGFSKKIGECICWASCWSLGFRESHIEQSPFDYLFEGYGGMILPTLKSKYPTVNSTLNPEQ